VYADQTVSPLEYYRDREARVVIKAEKSIATARESLPKWVRHAREREAPQRGRFCCSEKNRWILGRSRK